MHWWANTSGSVPTPRLVPDSARWLWFVISGLIELSFAFAVIVALPDAASSLLGIMLGINLALLGGGLVALVLAFRNASRQDKLRAHEHATATE